MFIHQHPTLQSAFTLGIEPSGREHAVVVVKGTYAFPEAEGAPVTLAPDQDDFVYADTFWGEPGFSAPRHEVDFGRFKPRCDVLINGHAISPEGRPLDMVRVGAKIGAWSKHFDVYGNRVWLDGVTAPNISPPEPFVRLPITYGMAFGGVDDLGAKEGVGSDVYGPNPVGIGWHDVSNQNRVTGTPVPNTQAPGEAITLPWGKYRPMSFGPVGRSWQGRLDLAGTYDDAWQEKVFPFLPTDFDVRYFQAAPADQQMPYPKGGEDVTLIGMTGSGRTRFRLPPLDMPVTFAHRKHGDIHTHANCDTIVIEPDRARVVLTWRVSQPLENEIFELREAIVGHRPKGYWRARLLGKAYHKGLRGIASKPVADQDA